MADEIVGRGAELAAVEPFLDRAATDLAVLVLEGEAGIGKSTVWSAAAELAGTRGCHVLTSRPARSEQGLTLGGLIDLLGGLDDGSFAGLPAPQREALQVALLRLEPSGPSPDQRTLSVAVAGLLRQLATPERALVLAIDDLQWLDDGSAAILAYAIRRLPGHPVGLLAATRTGAETTASETVLEAAPVERTDRVRLGPLHLASLHRLFELRLGRSFPRLVLVRIEEASGGNPLYALELGRALLASGIPADPHEPLPVPDTLGSLIARRVSALPARTRRAMVLLACSVAPTVASLEAATPGSAASLAPAVGDGLVSIDGDAVRFAHPLFAQGVMTVAGDGEVRAAHAALAAATASPDARARHLAQASNGPDERVARAVADAAAAARLRGATLDAASLYQEAARLTPTDDADAALRRSQLAA
ncbi:MAG TPA: ATP-binding protein, partial [Candidatus Limnocylindrales bacterium]